MPLRPLLAGAALLLAAFSVWAADAQIKQIDVDEDHVTSWNRFAGKAYDLHQRQIANRDIRQTEMVGVYNGTAASGYRYMETSYYDAHTGLLLSRVRVDRDRPKILHVVEVFLYDEQGRVVRDYAALYLPWSQNAPIRTLINVHQYNRDLHAYRQFDASGNRIYEQCKAHMLVSRSRFPWSSRISSELDRFGCIPDLFRGSAGNRRRLPGSALSRVPQKSLSASQQKLAAARPSRTDDC